MKFLESGMDEESRQSVRKSWGIKVLAYIITGYIRITLTQTCNIQKVNTDQHHLHNLVLNLVPIYPGYSGTIIGKMANDRCFKA